MRWREKTSRGLSLFETIIALFLMTLTLWSALILYGNLLGGTKLTAARQLALSEAESLLEDWRHRAKSEWPQQTDERLASTLEGEQNGYLYRVELSGLLPRPESDASLSTSPNLDMQLLKITVFYQDGKSDKRLSLVRGISP